MRDAGFTDVRHVPVLGGLMAIHVGRRGSAD
jgi:ubiquinone/menaquinone biosynthesis C-methylase UbiE